MARKIVTINNLKREFTVGEETVKALKGITFSITEGEFLTIQGSSGSGKTTLLNILGCLDKPTGGDYLLDGVNVKDLSRNQLADLRNKKVGFVFQSYNLLARTSALENVELPLFYNRKITAKERKERAMESLRMVNLENRALHTPSQLSGGQQQRVAIARALINDPVMLLADEATGNLDTRTSYEIMSVMQDLNHRGKTIVFVTHEADIALFSNRTIVLRDGRIQRDYVNDHVKTASESLLSLPVIEEDEPEDLL